MSTKHLLLLLLAVVILTTHSLADHHKPPHKPPSTEETALESNLDGKPPKGYKYGCQMGGFGVAIIGLGV